MISLEYYHYAVSSGMLVETLSIIQMYMEHLLHYRQCLGYWEDNGEQKHDVFLTLWS